MILNYPIFASLGANLFYGFCIILLAYHIANGWSEGLGRKLTGLIAIAAAWFGGYFLGPVLMPLAQSYLNWNISLLRPLTAVAIGAICYITVRLLGLLFTKRTRDHEGLSKTLSGIGGSLIGLGVGFVWLLVLLSGLKFANTLINGESVSHPAEEKGIVGKAFSFLDGLISDTPMKKFYDQIDPVPETAYRITAKTTKILGNKQARQDFIRSHEVKRMLNDPMIQEFASQKEIQELIQTNEYSKILSNEKTMDLIRNPEFLKLLDTYSIENAMDEAIRYIEK